MATASRDERTENWMCLLQEGERGEEGEEGKEVSTLLGGSLWLQGAFEIALERS